jgi:serine/threonine protein kinase
MHKPISYEEIVPGAHLGHYIISERIANGGMGTVFKAMEPALERYVAIKVLLPQYAQNPDYAQYFQEEARAVAALRHPNIVPIYFIGVENEIAFFAMAYIDGETFDDWIESNRRFTPENALWFMNQSVAALEAASAANIVHLDIKPANFLIDSTGTIMLTDFGLAQRINKQVADEEEREAFGTPAYVSPEQIRREKTDQRTDIYSLGASLFHLMVGVAPYDGDKVEDIVWGHLEKPFPVELAEKAHLSTGWIYLLKKMLEKSPVDRFQNYAELREALANVDRFRYETQPLEAPKSKPLVTPRSGANPNMLFGILRASSASWSTGSSSASTTIEVNRDRLLDNYRSRAKPLRIEKMVGTLKELCHAAEGDVDDLLDAFEKVPGFKDAAAAVAQFMAMSSGEPVQDGMAILEVLGLTRARTLALTFFMLNFEYSEPSNFDWRPLWQHQISVGLIIDFMYDALELQRTGMEYAAGLTHDIGKLVLSELYPFVYFSIMDAAIKTEKPLIKYEKDLLGITHGEMGQIWLTDRGFPSALADIAKIHDTPEITLRKSLLAHALISANHLCQLLGIGYSGNYVLDPRPWEDLPSTYAIWEARHRRDYTFDSFTQDFLTQFQNFPDLV